MDEKNMNEENNQGGNETPNSSNDTMMSGDETAIGTSNAETSFGPLVGIVIIVIILILGGLYFWGQRINDDIIPADDAVVESLEMQGTSDEVEAIEADLDATTLDTLDEDLVNIESELGL